jgi:hypothetical protein
MKANSKHYFLVIFGILTLVIVIFGYWFVYKVVIGQMQANSYAIEKLSIGQDSIKQQQKLLETEENTTEKRAKLLSYLTSDEKVLDFIKAVESIAGQTSTEVVLSAISPSGNTNKASSTISYIKIRANIRGDWTNVNKALFLIENFPYSISLDNVGIRLSDKNKWELSLDINALNLN